ncbi:HAD hydrolase-like protein [Fluviispira multicolorata]|uniref:HAD hydrolase-like protein n=1 Tax=Fluviispira multicolorata TaxID=2654512 RepID=A0A833JET6_9BACT|nr:HAD hydrolase-like protein [Fluviispira multicolorata]KAB8030019.1 HAD hydrolase-like protein [Fluviispira multicolorata]
MKIAVFDFDGVIADSRMAIFEAFKEISIRKKTPLITSDEILNLSIKQILSNYKIRWYQIPYYLNLSRKIIYLNRNLITLDPQIIKMFENINTENIKIIILSSNSECLINEFIQKNLPKIKFTEVIGGVSLFGKSKKIKQLIKRYSKNKSDFIYIGDEVRDIIAARSATIKSVAVLWGKESEYLLTQEKPNFIAKSGYDLAHILNKFAQE